MKLISWKSAGALLGTGALCCFVSAMVAPHNIKFYAPDPGSPPVIYSVPSTPPTSDVPLPPVAPPSTSAPPPPPPANRGYLSCEQMRGWDSTVVVEYWYSVGSPSALDSDRDGIPCESVLGERVFTPNEWPTIPPPPSVAVPVVPPVEEAPKLTPPPVTDRLPEAALPAPSPVPIPDGAPSGFLVP